MRFFFHQQLPWVESGRAFPRSYTTMDRYGDVKHIYAPQAANQPYGCMQVSQAPYHEAEIQSCWVSPLNSQALLDSVG